MALVIFDGTSRIYPGAQRPAVQALDLEIADGEFLVLVGASSCGKSTGLRMLAVQVIGDRLRGRPGRVPDAAARAAPTIVLPEYTAMRPTGWPRLRSPSPARNSHAS